MDTCILISTSDKYALLAEFTVALIDMRWNDHPPIFICGLSRGYWVDIELLPLDKDPQDWIGIAESAARRLLGLGYRKVYLILDDHPPLQICNEFHLNKTLPMLMEVLNAAYIGLHGWDQNTLSSGVVLGRDYYFLQRQSESFIWQYALHPALWDLRALGDIAKALSDMENDLVTRSIWAFERKSGANPSLIPHIWQGRAYRVFGLGMLGGRSRLIRGFFRRLLYLSINFLYLTIKTLFGVAVQERLVNYFIHETLFFDGPYPLYWSGVMQKGSLNKYFERYLLSHRRNSELFRFKEILESQNK